MYIIIISSAIITTIATYISYFVVKSKIATYIFSVIANLCIAICLSLYCYDIIMQTAAYRSLDIGIALSIVEYLMISVFPTIPVIQMLFPD